MTDKEVEELVKIADVLLSKLRGKGLRDLEMEILKASLLNLRYRDVAEKLGYTIGHIRGVAQQLWKDLSISAIANITKKTVLITLKQIRLHSKFLEFQRGNGEDFTKTIDDLIGNKNIIDAIAYAESYKQLEQALITNQLTKNPANYITSIEDFQNLLSLTGTATLEFVFTETQLITILILPGKKSPIAPKELRWQLKNNPLETLAPKWISILTAKTQSNKYLPNLLNFKKLLKNIPPETNDLSIISDEYLH